MVKIHLIKILEYASKKLIVDVSTNASLINIDIVNKIYERYKWARNKDYLQYLSENKAEFGSMLKSRLKKLIPEMDRNWGMLLNSFEDIMHTITNASFSNKQANEASIYSDNFNNARNIFFSKIINIILGDNIKQVIKEHKNILNYVHLPIQSGSNRILKLMGRSYTKESYKELYATNRRNRG